MKLTHVRLLADDVPATVAFYRDVLGFEVTADFGQYVELAAGEAILSVFVRSGQQDAIALEAPGDRIVPGFHVESADRAAEQYRDHVAGGPVDRPDWGLRVVWLRDPAGNLLELYEQIPMSE